MRRGQRYFLLKLEGIAQADTRALEGEIEKILGKAGMGIAEFQTMRELRDGSGAIKGKLEPDQAIVRSSLRGEKLLRGAFALVSRIGPVPARVRTIRASGTLKALLCAKPQNQGMGIEK